MRSCYAETHQFVQGYPSGETKQTDQKKDFDMLTRIWHSHMSVTVLRNRLIVFLSLVFPGLATLHKFFHYGMFFWGALIFYAAFLGIYMPALSRSLDSETERSVLLKALILFILIGGIFILVYPVANAGYLFAGGSDNDDAFNLAVRQLLAGQYPYDGHTYLGGKIAYFPGAIILSVPFFILGNAAYQDFFWLIVFFAQAAKYFKNPRPAFSMVLCVFVSPGVVHSFVIGSELVASAIYTLIFMTWCCDYINHKARWRFILSAFLLGVSVSSRANYFFILPLAFGFWMRVAGLKKAILGLVVAGAAFFMVTAPFVFHEPLSFTPLMVQKHKWDFVIQYFHVDPGLIIGGGGVLLALFLAKNIKSIEELYLKCATTQAYFIIVYFILKIIVFAPDFINVSMYGVTFLFFGCLGAWKSGYVTRAQNSPVLKGGGLTL